MIAAAASSRADDAKPIRMRDRRDVAMMSSTARQISDHQAGASHCTFEFEAMLTATNSTSGSSPESRSARSVSESTPLASLRNDARAAASATKNR